MDTLRKSKDRSAGAEAMRLNQGVRVDKAAWVPPVCRYVAALYPLACFIFTAALIVSCRPKEPEPLLIGKIWRAQVVKEGNQVVYTQGAVSNTQPGYANFRLNLTDPQKAVLIDRDGKTITGTWSVSTDNKRLILENLKPIPTNTIGTIEYYITTPPTPGTLPLQRTAESRKTGNTVNDYQLVPLE